VEFYGQSGLNALVDDKCFILLFGLLFSDFFSPREGASLQPNFFLEKSSSGEESLQGVFMGSPDLIFSCGTCHFVRRSIYTSLGAV
jgi:hypothetical protein